MADVTRLPVMRGAVIAPGGTLTLNFGSAMGAGYIRSRPATPYDSTALTVVYFAYGTVPPAAATVGSGRYGIQPQEAVNLGDTEFTDLSFRADAGAVGVVIEVIAFPRPGEGTGIS